MILSTSAERLTQRCKRLNQAGRGTVRGEMASILGRGGRGTGVGPREVEFSAAGPRDYGSRPVALSSFPLSISVLRLQCSGQPSDGVHDSEQNETFSGSGVPFRPILSHPHLPIWSLRRHPGRCTGHPGRCTGHPGRCRWALLFWPFRPAIRMQIDSKEQRWRRGSGMANSPRRSTMLPPPCPLPSRARRKALPRAGKRDWEGEGIF